MKLEKILEGLSVVTGLFGIIIMVVKYPPRDPIPGPLQPPGVSWLK